ncbi:MAG TPA: hypothetical protein VF961_08625 [Pyrinomonadaceae bacterium]
MTQTKNIVLVHGGFVDGSGWESVYSLLKKDDYNVAIVQNPTLSLAGDVAATKLVIHEQDGPVILVGHQTSCTGSCGGDGSQLRPEAVMFAEWKRRNCEHDRQDQG